MEQWLLLIVVLALIAAVIFIVRLWKQRLSAPPLSSRQRAALIDMETRNRDDGTTIAEAPDLVFEEDLGPARLGWPAIIGNLPFWQKLFGGVVFALFVGTAAWLLAAVLFVPTTERYLVLVAPFNDAGNGQTGQVVANDLVRVLQEQAADRMQVELLDRAPADAQTALHVAIDRQADLLIWGDVQAGGMLDGPSLTPRLIYTPGGAYAPDVWAGYLGRFSMPRSFSIADEPINGRAVLPRLLTALADYNRGKADIAFNELGSLTEDYPPLNVTLPRAIRGNILWARGSYSEAAGEYRRALAHPSDEQARLANNLGAILMDAGDAAALTVLGESVQLLNGQDLGALRFNLALMVQREGRVADAVSNLEQARNLMPPNTPLLLALAEAYREAGNLSAAEAALADAEPQIRSDVAQVPADLRPVMNARLDGLFREQRALMLLARQVNAQGPLTWELEVATPPPPGSLNGARDEARSAVQTSESLIDQWRARSTADAAANTGAGLVPIGQMRQAERELERQRYHLALLLAEEGREAVSRPRGFFGAMVDAIFGNGTPVGESQNLLNRLLATNPDNIPARIAYARVLRMQNLADPASQQYDEALNRAPQWPEGYYGKGMLALAGGDRDGARQWFSQALDRNGGFFPARMQLATLAEQDGDWETTLGHLRALAQQRPGNASSLALAAALRRSGPGGYAEAERVLNELLAATPENERAPILVELGRLYQAAGQTDQAVQTLEQARRANSRSSEAAYELGQSLNAQGRPADAATQFLDAVALDPGNTPARLALANLYQTTLNQPTEANRLYQEVVNAGMNDVTRLLQAGDALLANGQPTPAGEAYGKALALQPDNPQARHRMAQAYLAVGSLDAAADAEQRVLALTEGVPGDEARILRAAALVGLGDVERRRGNPDRAVDFYNQALSLNTVQVDAAMGLGLVAVSQGNWAVARSHFETAMGFPDGPNNPLAQFWLAESMLRQNDLPGAIEHYGRALELRPNFPEAFLGTAQAQYSQNDPDAANLSLDQAFSLRPNYAEGYLFRGKMLQEQGDLDGALTAYNSSISANNRIAEAHYRRGLLYAQRQDYDRAISDLQRAGELQPNFAEAYYWLGRSYFAQEQMALALDSLQRAVAAQGGNYTEARLYQGLVEEALGQRDNAISSFQAVLQADGAGEWGTRARTELERLQ